MNFAQKDKAEWWDATWNPFVGCDNGCEWCYARKQAKRVGAIIGCEKCSRFEFHLHRERLEEPLKHKKPSIIFAGSMCDFFCEAAGSEPPITARAIVRLCPQHQFVVLTKCPQNIPRGWNDDVPNLWVGVSVTREHEQPDYKRAMTLLDRIQERRILCVEPLLGPPVVRYPMKEFTWPIIGGLTGGGKRQRHSLDWVIRLVGDSQTADVPIFLKRNLAPEVPTQYVMAHREYPPELAAERKEQGDDSKRTD